MSDSDVHYDNLIIGGGISGLGLGHLCLGKGVRTRVLEREPSVGGCIYSQAFPEAGNFWVEMGSHTCYNSYGNLLGMIDDLGLTPRLTEKAKVRFKVLQNQRLVSVFSLLHPLEAALSIPRLFTEKKTNRSVADYYSRVLGTRNYQELFEPAFNAVICQPAGEFPADKLFRRKPRRKDRPRSFTLPAGLSAITHALSDQAGLEVSTACAVHSVKRLADGFAVNTEDGQTLHSRRLSLAVPPDVAARLLADDFPALAQSLANIAMAEIESEAVIVRRGDLSTAPLAGIIAPKDEFYAAVSRDYLDDPDYRGFTFHFRPRQSDPDARLRRICEVLSISQDAIVARAYRPNRLPALRLGHDQLVEQIDRQLTDSGLALVGNYFIGVSIEDCLSRCADEFKRLWG